MPRLFQSRARPSREHTREEYPQYQSYKNDNGDYGYGYQRYDGREQEPQHSSSWSRVLTKKAKVNERTYQGEYEDRRRDGWYRANVEEYPEEYQDDQLDRETFSDDTESFVEIMPRRSSPIPVVQRESSLSRIQEAFADHGAYEPASQATTAEQDTPRYNSRELGRTGPLEMATVQEARQGPVMVSSPPKEGIRADVMHPPSRREHRSGKRRDPYAQSDYPRNVTYDDYNPHEEPPPVTVVVEHGRHGEKDTYYIIPDGAPVIFKDEDGNELTRLGDFSGNYKPAPIRPVIIQDQYGREICRAGFEEAGQASKSRSNDDLYYEDDRSSRRGLSSNQRGVASQSSSRKYNSNDYDDENHYSSRNTVRESPNVVYIDPFSPRKQL
ncbi:hypothetical protein BKA93DRAFT_830148 [Sparassis latifolia]